MQGRGAVVEGHSALATFVLAAIAYLSTGCSQPNRDPSTVAFLIEANPTNLDPYIDARSSLDCVKIYRVFACSALMQRRGAYSSLQASGREQRR